jgi:hypothetical protein
VDDVVHVVVGHHPQELALLVHDGQGQEVVAADHPGHLLLVHLVRALMRLWSRSRERRNTPGRARRRSRRESTPVSFSSSSTM